MPFFTKNPGETVSIIIEMGESGYHAARLNAYEGRRNDMQKKNKEVGKCSPVNATD